MSGLIVQDLDNRRYRVVYVDSKNGGSLTKVIGNAAACEVCTKSQLLHIALGEFDELQVLIKVEDVREVWESAQPIQEPHDYTGEVRVF